MSNNEELMQVKEQLIEVINLTESLIRLKKKGPSTSISSSFPDSSFSSSFPSETANKKRELEENGEEDNLEEKKKASQQKFSVNSKGEFVVPKSLRIVPTDSEEARETKRKRIKSMKSQWKRSQLEDDRSTRTNAWQQFASKKQKIGSFAPNKTSIFRSPDSVTGKVGVTGSGKGMTASSTFKAKTLAVKKEIKLPLPE
eukprot:TRINITY_DN1726_c0_g1_i2.p1 TRINITY_DN1726_c0_g1~~TRINITY_DN1726_c0_g1_i2.p1  ORF type:complete len:199 (+),score=77.23 TRINITY_DN1726_c0_g1_i2:286-882(+)